MKKKLLVATALAALALTSGCTGLSGTLQSLGNDPAIVSGSLMTPYGSTKFVRVGGNRSNQTVTVSTDGTVTITNVGAGTNTPTPVSIVSAPATVTTTPAK